MPLPDRIAVTTREAGKLIGVNTSRVRQLILAGQLKANKPAGMRRHYILMDDLMAFLTDKPRAR